MTAHNETVKSSRGFKTHWLKNDPVQHEALHNGLKTFEIRFDDRDYQVGDVLIMQETVYSGAEMSAGAPLVFTGRQVGATAAHIMKGPQYGLQPGWCLISLQVARITP